MRHCAAEACLPVRLVEIGASAGLNLRADRFHIPGEAGRYGDPTSPVVLADAWRGQPPPAAPVEVVDRTGGDRTPIDPTTPQGRLTLAAYVWPDQADRMERLRGALAVAAQLPADLRQEPASDTLRRAALADGSWTVLWHSIVRQYLDEAQRAAVTEGIAALGAAATPSARFAWLSLEPHRITAHGECLVALTTWPGGHQRVLGTAPPHGLPVTWAPPGSARSGSLTGPRRDGRSLRRDETLGAERLGGAGRLPTAAPWGCAKLRRKGPAQRRAGTWHC